MRGVNLMLGLAVMAAAPASATANDLRSVAAMQYHQRVLLVFAPALADPRLATQRRELDAHALAMAERDVVLVQVGADEVVGAHDRAARLRRRFHVRADEYRTLLIGKDGHVAMAIVGPISAAHLAERIDAMPMRQAEMRAARTGHKPALP